MNEITIPILFFIITAILFTILERKYPLKKIDVKRTLKLDISMIVWSFSISGFFLLSIKLALSPFDYLRPSLSEFSELQIFLFFSLCADFSKYIFHWMMHLPFLWPAHRLHHMPKELHWLAGNRASLLMLFLHFTPIGIIAWYLNVGPEFIILNSLINILWNHLMHTNIKINSKISHVLEWFIVTPRYHHIHHGLSPDFSGKNFGSVLTVWDRLFKTYYDPSQTNTDNILYGDFSTQTEDLNWKILLGLN